MREPCIYCGKFDDEEKLLCQECEMENERGAQFVKAYKECQQKFTNTTVVICTCGNELQIEQVDHRGIVVNPCHNCINYNTKTHLRRLHDMSNND